jgi:nitrate/nitrite transport system ATP-binding protein
METFLELSQLGKTYDTPQGPAVIVSNVNLRVRKGEFVCIIGHSGCGKSTILSIVMGLNDATEGGVILAGKEVTDPGTDRGVVFQAPALLPWLTARENVLLAVEQANGRHSQMDRRQLAGRYLAQVGLEAEADLYPDALSAGMRQRVGIARAFALEPKILLLDEPFSLLDALTRLELQDELLRLWEKDRKTVLMVTHDVDEALLLADRIVMMTSGPAATIGETLDIPFPRPRIRGEVLNHPVYYRLRDHLITFLEERASPPHLLSQPTVTPYQAVAARERKSVLLTEEERFSVEKYTGFNRFRRKYRGTPKAQK